MKSRLFESDEPKKKRWSDRKDSSLNPQQKRELKGLDGSGRRMSSGMPRSDEEQGARQQQMGWGSETNTTVRKNADGSTSAQISGPTNQVQAQAPGVAQQAGVSDQGSSLGDSVDQRKQQVREYLKRDDLPQGIRGRLQALKDQWTAAQRKRDVPAQALIQKQIAAEVEKAKNFLNAQGGGDEQGGGGSVTTQSQQSSGGPQWGQSQEPGGQQSFREIDQARERANELTDNLGQYLDSPYLKTDEREKLQSVIDKKRREIAQGDNSEENLDWLRSQSFRELPFIIREYDKKVASRQKEREEYDQSIEQFESQLDDFRDASKRYNLSRSEIDELEDFILQTRQSIESYKSQDNYEPENKTLLDDEVVNFALKARSFKRTSDRRDEDNELEPQRQKKSTRRSLPFADPSDELQDDPPKLVRGKNPLDAISRRGASQERASSSSVESDKQQAFDQESEQQSDQEVDQESTPKTKEKLATKAKKTSRKKAKVQAPETKSTSRIVNIAKSLKRATESGGSTKGSTQDKSGTTTKQFARDIKNDFRQRTKTELFFIRQEINRLKKQLNGLYKYKKQAKEEETIRLINQQIKYIRDEIERLIDERNEILDQRYYFNQEA